jgi:hypothetical protein
MGGHRGPPLRVMVNAMANRRGNPLWLPRWRRLRGWRSRMGGHRGPPLRVMVQRNGKS